MTSPLSRRLARLEGRQRVHITSPNPAEMHRLHERIRVAVEATESVLGARDNLGAMSLIERVARVHRMTDGVAFPWWPEVRDRRGCHGLQ